MGASMRAVAVTADGTLELIDHRKPTPASDEVLIEVEGCGICHGDTAVVEGRLPGLEYPHIPGHEVGGRIEGVGDAVTEWDPGDRVATGWYAGHCFRCDPCRAGDYTNCEHGDIHGMTTQGGYAEYMTVPREAVARVPGGVPLEDAGPLACAGMTAFNGLRNSSASPGDTVAIQGIGGVGHLAVQIAAAAGYEPIAVSRGPAKRETALDLGATGVVDAAASDPAEELSRMGGADVILTTVPDATAIESVVGGLAANGELLVVGAPDESVELDLTRFLNNRWRLQGWSSGHARDIEETLAFCASHGVAPLTETFALDDAVAGYEAMVDGAVRFRSVLTP